jgi:hypothetical protein
MREEMIRMMRIERRRLRPIEDRSKGKEGRQDSD